MPKASKLLEFYNKTVHAESEEDLDFIFGILNPTDSKEEMGKVYEDSLGYNPLDFFDKKTLSKKFDEFLTDAPSSIQSELKEKRNGILDRSLLQRDRDEDAHLSMILASEIYAETGWSAPGFYFMDSLSEEDEEVVDDDEDDDEFDKEDDSYD